VTSVDLRGLLPAELAALAQSMGEPPFRARQIQAWVLRRGVRAIEQMTDLSKDCRRRLAEVAHLTNLRLVDARAAAAGEAVKFLFELADGSRVESVLIADGSRRTACLSTQVGCPLGCAFCATARMGFVRHLTAGEIVDQLLQIGAFAAGRGERVSNAVMMGMGEPLLNYDAVVRALRLMRLELGPGLGGRRITVSTAGIVPRIRRLAREQLHVGLAISLNATLDEQRRRIMPVARRYSLEELLAAAEDFFAQTGRRVTLEYVLLAGVNDSLEDARRLAAIGRRLPCKINLIPYNEVSASAQFRRPAAAWIDAFRQALERATPVPVTLRESRGADIDAACGQLYQRHASNGHGPAPSCRPEGGAAG